jgi:hypothetical protein
VFGEERVDRGRELVRAIADFLDHLIRIRTNAIASIPARAMLSATVHTAAESMRIMESVPHTGS